MNDIIETFIHDHLFLHLVLIAVSMTAIIIAMGIDFISGIQKAKQRGELRTSKKYKMTATKAKKYFNPFLTLVMIDLICCIVIPFPVFAMLWAVYCVFCEFKSVREKSWEKAELRKAEKTMSIIIENKDDIARLAAQNIVLKHKKKRRIKMTRGLRNNNPLNIRRNNTKWQGLSATQTDKSFFSLKLWHTVIVHAFKTLQTYILNKYESDKDGTPMNLKMLLCDGHRHVRTILKCILPQSKSVQAYLVIQF
jgi:hypothetical protein